MKDKGHLLPSTWELLPLGQLVIDHQTGFASGEKDEAGVIQVRMNNVTTEGFLDLTNLRRVPATSGQITRFQVSPGDILFNNTNSPELVGKTVYFPGHAEPVVFSNHFTRLRPNPDRLDGRYLARYFSSLWQSGTFSGMCTQWVNQASVRQERLLSIKIPLPPLPEQRRLATILDKADSIRRKRREAPKLADEFLRAAFLDLFGGPVANLKNWDQRTLEKVVRPGTSITYGIVQAGPHVEDGVPYIRTGDFKNGELQSNGLGRTAPEIAAKFQRSRVEAGDLVYCIRASIGSVDIVPPELDGANLTQGTARIACGDDINNEFLKWQLRTSEFGAWIDRHSKGATFKEITLETLRNAPVIVPPLALQYRFVTMAQTLDRLVQRQRAQLQAASACFDVLSHRAFQGTL